MSGASGSLRLERSGILRPERSGALMLEKSGAVNEEASGAFRLLKSDGISGSCAGSSLCQTGLRKQREGERGLLLQG